MDSSGNIAVSDVFVGVWTDYSRPYGLRTILTLDIQYARYLISATSLFITIIGSCVWTIIAFFVHKQLATRNNVDGLLMNLRILYRNAGAEFGTLWDICQILQAWRRSKVRPIAKKIKRRAFLVAIPPLLNASAFAAFSILAAKVAGSSYQSNHVRLKPGNCGSVVWNWDLIGLQKFQLARFQQQVALNETQAARLYAHNCYQPDSKSAPCSTFPTKSIPYEVTRVDCPFGMDSAGNSLCLPDGNTALEYTTPLLDTDSIFGINAAAEKRIQIRKSLTCAPIRISEYIRIENQGFQNATTYLDLGPIIGVSDYTLAYNPRSKNDSVGYQLINLVPGGGAIWSPIDALKVMHGDVSINILASNSVKYLEPVEDLWFSANTFVDNLSPNSAYMSDNDISVLACIDRSQICNPNHNPSSCTILGSGNDLFESYQTIELNNYQTVTALRMGQILPMTSTFVAVNGLGSSSLLASANIAALLSTGLPPDQWQREVKDWFEIGLAAMQAGVVQWINNNMDLGIFGHIVHPDPKVTVLPASYFCENQRIRNTGQYVSFSFLGLMIILCVGLPLIILSWIIEDVDRLFRKLKNWRRVGQRRAWTQQEVVYIADHYLQLLRKTLSTTESDCEWENLLKKVPTTRGNRNFQLPELVEIDGVLDYHVPMDEDDMGTIPVPATEDVLPGDNPSLRPALAPPDDTEQATDEFHEKPVVLSTAREMSPQRSSSPHSPPKPNEP